MGQFNAQEINNLLSYMTDEDIKVIDEILTRAKNNSYLKALINKTIKIDGQYYFIQDIKKCGDMDGYVDVVCEWFSIDTDSVIYQEKNTLHCMNSDFLKNHICPYYEYKNALMKLEDIINKRVEIIKTQAMIF